MMARRGRMAGGGGSPGVWTPFVHDTFTEGGVIVPLTAHTGELGATWTMYPGYTAGGNNAYVFSSVDRLGGAVSAGYTSYHYASGQASSSSYRIRASIYTNFDFVGYQVQLRGRQLVAADSCYVLKLSRISAEFAQLLMIRRVNGSQATVASNSTVAGISAQSVHTLQLDMIDGAGGTELTGYLDGAPILTYTDASPITDAGYIALVGQYGQADTTGYQVDEVTAEELL